MPVPAERGGWRGGGVSSSAGVTAAKVVGARKAPWYDKIKPCLDLVRLTSTVAHPEKQQISNLLNFSSLPTPW